MEKLCIGLKKIVEIGFRVVGAKSKAKPEGVQGCEIRGINLRNPRYRLVAAYYKLFRYAFSSQNYFHRRGEDRGKHFYFALRWENKRGDKGAWSEIYSAIIP